MIQMFLLHLLLYLSMLSSLWFLLFPSSSTSFLSPQLMFWGSLFDVGPRGVTSHLTPASCLRLQPWMFCPREGHSPRNSSFPVHLTWSRWMGPFPWPNPPAATAPPLRRRRVGGNVWNKALRFKLSLLSHKHTPVSELSAHHGGVQVVPARVANASPVSMEIHLDSTFLPAAAAHETHQWTWQEEKLSFIFMFECPQRRESSDGETGSAKCHLLFLYSTAILGLMGFRGV